MLTPSHQATTARIACHVALMLSIALAPHAVADEPTRDEFAFRVQLSFNPSDWTPLPCDGSASPIEKSLGELIDSTPRGDQLGATERQALVQDLQALACYFGAPSEAGYSRVVDPRQRMQPADLLEKGRQAAATSPLMKGRIENPESATIEKLAGALMDGFHELGKAPKMRAESICLGRTALRFGSVSSSETVTRDSVRMPHPGIADANYGVGGRIYDSAMDYASEIQSALKRDGAVRFADVIMYFEFSGVPNPATAGKETHSATVSLAMRLYYNSENNRWYPVNGYLGADVPRMIAI